MNKISFVLHSLNGGGAEKRASTIANYLCDNGFDVEIVLLDNNEIIYELDKRIKIVFLNCSSSIESNAIEKVATYFYKILSNRKNEVYDLRLFLKNKYGIRIKRYFSDKKDRTIVSWTSFCSVATIDACKNFSNEIIFVECTSPEAEFPKNSAMNILKKELYPRANKCVCQTDEICEFYTFLNNTNKFIIPNPILGNFPARYEGERKKIIVNYCHFVYQKNLKLLIDAFELVHNKKQEYQLMIYGYGYLKDELNKYIKDRKLDTCIFIKDFEANIHEKIIDYAMFVSSSDREGISNSMLESLTIGLPTICTDCDGGGAKMIINDHENGILVPKGDKKALANAMLELIDNQDLANKFSRNGVKVKDSYSIDRIGKMWIDALVK